MRKIVFKLVLIVSIITIGCVCFFSIPNAYAATLSEVDILNEYMINSDLSIPKATLTVNDKTENASHVIVYPSGKAYDKSDVVLDELGKYTIEYSAYFNNRKYSNTVEFRVINSLYSFDYSDTAKATRYTDYQLNEYDGTVSTLDGLLVELPKDSVFKYNKIIDLSDMNEKDNLITFSILPDVIGTEDFQHLYFRLTDINDSSNYVTISFHDVQKNELIYGDVNKDNASIWDVYSYTFTRSYVKAGASFQAMIGMEITKEEDKIHINNEYGHNTPTSFHGTPIIDKFTGLATNIIAGNQSSVNINYAEREIYVNDNDGLGLVVDLDSKQFNSKLWEGFSDGKAYLSMWADDYTSKKPAKVFVYDIANDKLNDTKLVDDEAPVLNVDYLGVNKNALPKGIVGYAYPLFNANAKDFVDADCEVTSLVYYNYNSANRSLCKVTDGKFIPNRSGKYTVINKASDKSGNVAVESYSIDVLDTAYEVNLSVSNIIEQCNIGTEISLGELLVDLPNGFYTYETTVKCNSKDYKVEENTFTPKQKGTHTVLYTVTDFLGRKFEYSYNFECLTDGAAVAFDTVVFNKYLISGNTYQIPKLEAYDFSSDNNGVLVELQNYLTDSNGRNLVKDTFVPVVSESGQEVIIEYVYNDVIVQSYSISCFITKNENGIDMSKYFATVSGDISVSTLTAGVAINTVTDETKVEFINYLTADKFKLEFNINKEKNNFRNFIVYLKDAYDETNQIKIDFKNDGNHASVRVDKDKNVYQLNSSFMDDTYKFNIVYDSLANAILTDDDLGVSISLNDFGGFDSKMIIVAMEFTGVKGESEVILSNLDGQPLNNQTIDAISPKLVFDGEYKKKYSINTEFQLYKAYSSDVLSPNINFKLTVKDPTGKVIDSKDGIKLENVTPDQYTILLDQYGKYSLVYKVTDGSGRTRQYVINLDVSDEIEPELTLSSETEIITTVGSVVVLPTATAKDNLDEELKIYVYLINPNGESTPLQGTFNNETSFRPLVKGVYKIKYLVSDSAGNFTMKVITVNVE
jgi:hypothetical protein